LQLLQRVMIPVFQRVTLRVSRDNDLIHIIYFENSIKKICALIGFKSCY